MNYPEYYEKCKQRYSEERHISRDKTRESSFYSNPVRHYGLNLMSSEYEECVNSLATKVKYDFEHNLESTNDGIMHKHDNIWKFKEEIDKICKILVPKLEEDFFYCNLYVDKIYIYRTAQTNTRISSYIWHYDNNPNEVVKTIIYLSEVSDDTRSPYEYFTNPSGHGVLAPTTRTGKGNWNPPPNNSRVDGMVEEAFKSSEGWGSKRVFGKMGTSCTFVNNAIHRANPILEGYRDVINIRVKPTLDPAPEYANVKWTTGFETPGVVNQNPEYAWRSLV